MCGNWKTPWNERWCFSVVILFPSVNYRPVSPCCEPSVAVPAHTQSLVGMSLDEIEKSAISETLQAFGGNKSETARRLGITRKTLQAKLVRYGLAGDE
jgi:two-component system response regulator HydG